MKPRFHIITPFNRPHNLPVFWEMFWAMNGAALWYPVCHDVRHAEAIYDAGFPNVLLYEHTQDFDICYAKINAALGSFEFPDGDYVGFLCDDDRYDDNVIHRLADRATGQDVLAISARRWERGVSPKWHGGVLSASKENTRVCHIGLEQFFVKAEVMSNYRFGNHGCADGELAEKLVADNRSFLWCSDLFVNWNCLPDTAS